MRTWQEVEPTREAVREARAVIEFCFERGWTDGLPVVPPAEEFVEEFLAQVDRDPEEVLIAQPHLGRKCTVRLRQRTRSWRAAGRSTSPSSWRPWRAWSGPREAGACCRAPAGRRCWW
jgi:hypothetical protein